MTQTDAVAFVDLDQRYERMKRGLDVMGAMAGLMLAAPVMAVIAYLIRRDSPGPAIFRQERVGRHGRLFQLYKFRTMDEDNDDTAHREYVRQLLIDDAPADGGEQGVYKLTADPRVTRIGRGLRRTSIDELPQLMNVLRGEMSLVGPRPALLYEVPLFSSRHRMRTLVKPGMTGLWQVSGRSELTMREALELDVEYVQRRSLALDLRILARTFAVILKGGAAR